jgi:hypothetical protein
VTDAAAVRHRPAGEYRSSSDLDWAGRGCLESGHDSAQCVRQELGPPIELVAHLEQRDVEVGEVKEVSKFLDVAG